MAENKLVVTGENPEDDLEEVKLDNGRDEITLVQKIFLNDLIAPQILDKLSVADWKSIRLVCREWYKTTNRHGSRNAFVHLEGCDDDNPIKGSHHSNYSIKAFLDFVESTKESLGRFSFQNFSLENWNIKDEQDGHQNLETYLRFTEMFSRQIRHLRIINFQFQKGNETFYNVVRNLAPNMKTLEFVVDEKWSLVSYEFLSPLYLKADVHLNLKRLEIYWSPSPLIRHRLPEYVELNFSFLLKFPNLKELKLKASDLSARKLISTLCMMRPLRRRQNALKLTHLDVIESYQHLVGFVEAELPLKYLSLHVGSMDEDRIKIVLEHCSKHLETLKLITMTSSTIQKLPSSATFANLRELELWGNMTESLDFLLATPVLKRLRVDLYCFEKRDTCTDLLLAITVDLVQNSYKLLEKELFRVLSLEEFQIESVLGVESWKILGDWMPNLNVLDAPLNNDTFDAVCSQWPSLYKLKLRLGSDVDDDGITGQGVMAVRKSNITDLKHLRCFELEVLCGRERLTDKAAAQGFLQLDNLSCLRIPVSNFMSLEMEETLKNAIEDVRICRPREHCAEEDNGALNSGRCCKFIKLMNKLNVNSFY